MKKLIAILAIAVILVGAVFAATQENHKIQIHGSIEELVPAFQLWYRSDIKTNDSADVYADDAGTARAANIDAIAKETYCIDLEGGDSISFTVKLLNAAKIVKVYTITMDGGVFATTTNTTATPAVPTIATAAVNENAASGGVAVSGLGVKNATVTFNGTRCVAGDLFTVTYTYAAHPEYDPIDDITADVTMLIETT